MRMIGKILMMILIICIPVTSILAAYNVVFRLPDLYIYELNSSQAMTEVNLSISSEEMGDVFSDYLFGKKDTFSLTADYNDREQEVFSIDEQLTMENIRELLNISLWVLLGTTLLTLIIYWIFLMNKEKLLLRGVFKFSFFIYIVLSALNIAAFYYAAAKQWLKEQIFKIPLSEEAILPLFLTENFARDCIFVAIGGSLVVMIIVGSITWRLTRPRRMFSGL